MSLASSPSSSVMVGDSITLTCSVVLPDGVTGTPGYQWMGPAGGVIDTATHSSNDHSVSSVLTLSEIAPSQAGEYTCTATLANGASNTTSIIVTVQSKFKNYFYTSIILTIVSQVSVTNPSVSASTADITAGDTVYLTCDYALSQSVDVTISVMWMVDGSAVDTSTDGEETSNGDKITFAPVTTSDTGRYTCTLTSTVPHAEFIEPVQSAEKEIIVQSIRVHFLLYVCYCMYLILFLPPVPQPGVAITLSHTAPLYAGTSLTLTCTVTLDPNVNNNEREL